MSGRVPFVRSRMGSQEPPAQYPHDENSPGVAEHQGGPIKQSVSITSLANSLLGKNSMNSGSPRGGRSRTQSARADGSTGGAYPLAAGFPTATSNITPLAPISSMNIHQTQNVSTDMLEMNNGYEHNPQYDAVITQGCMTAEQEVKAHSQGVSQQGSPRRSPINMFDKTSNGNRMKSNGGATRNRSKMSGPRPYIDTIGSPLTSAGITSANVDVEFEQFIAQSPNITNHTRNELLALDKDTKLGMLRDAHNRNSAKQLYASGLSGRTQNGGNVDTRLGGRQMSSQTPSQFVSRQSSISPSRFPNDNYNNNIQDSPAKKMAYDLMNSGMHLPGRASLVRDSRINSRNASFLMNPKNTTSLDNKLSKIADHAQLSDIDRAALMRLDVSRKVQILDEYMLSKELSRERKLNQMNNSFGQRPISIEDLQPPRSPTQQSTVSLDGSRNSAAVGPRQFSEATIEFQQTTDALTVDRMFSKLMDSLNIFGTSRDGVMRKSIEEKKEIIEQFLYIKDQISAPLNDEQKFGFSNSSKMLDVDAIAEAQQQQYPLNEEDIQVVNSQLSQIQEDQSLIQDDSGIFEDTNIASHQSVTNFTNKEEELEELMISPSEIDPAVVSILSRQPSEASIKNPSSKTSSIKTNNKGNAKSGRQPPMLNSIKETSFNESSLDNPIERITNERLSKRISVASPEYLNNAEPKIVPNYAGNSMLEFGPILNRTISQRSAFDVLVEHQFGKNIPTTVDNVKNIRSNHFNNLSSTNESSSTGEFKYSKPKPKSPERLDSLDPTIVLQRGGLDTPIKYVALLGSKSIPMKVLHRHLTAFRVSVSLFGPDFASAFVTSTVPYMGDNGINGLDALTIALARISTFRTMKAEVLDNTTSLDVQHTDKPLPTLPAKPAPIVAYEKPTKTTSLRSLFKRGPFSGNNNESVPVYTKPTESHDNNSSSTSTTKLYADTVLEDELALEAVLCVKEIMKVEDGYQAVIRSRPLIMILSHFLFCPALIALVNMDSNLVFRPSALWKSNGNFEEEDQEGLDFTSGRQSQSTTSLGSGPIANTASQVIRRNQNRRAIRANLDLRVNIVELLGPISVLSNQGHRMILECLNDICDGDTHKFGYLVNCILDPFAHPEKVTFHNIYVSDDDEYMGKVWMFRVSVMVLINSLIVATIDINDRMKLRKIFESKGLIQVMEMIRSIHPPTPLLIQFDTYLDNRTEDILTNEDTFRNRNEILMGIGQISSEYFPKIHKLRQPNMAENKIRNVMMYISRILDAMPRDDQLQQNRYDEYDEFRHLDDDMNVTPAYIESDLIGNDILQMIDRLLKTISLWCTSVAESGISTDPTIISEHYQKMSDELVRNIEDITGLAVNSSMTKEDSKMTNRELQDELNRIRFLYKKSLSKNEYLEKQNDDLKVDLFRERHVLNHITHGKIQSASNLTDDEYAVMTAEEKRRTQKAFQDSQKLRDLLSKLKDYKLIGDNNDDSKKTVIPAVTNENITRTLNDIITQVGLLHEIGQSLDNVEISVKKPQQPTVDTTNIGNGIQEKELDSAKKAKDVLSPNTLLHTIRRIKAPARQKNNKGSNSGSNVASPTSPPVGEYIDTTTIKSSNGRPKSIKSPLEKETSVTSTGHEILVGAAAPPAPPPPPPPFMAGGESKLSLTRGPDKFVTTEKGSKVIQSQTGMRTLQWDKIPYSSANKSIWGELSETAYDNDPRCVLDEYILTDLFKREAPLQKSKPTNENTTDFFGTTIGFGQDKDNDDSKSVKSLGGQSTRSIKKKKITLLDSKRARNIEIMLGVIRCPYETIRDAIITFDEHVLTLDNLEGISMFIPTEDECRLIRNFKPGPDEELGNAESYIMSIMDIPRLAQRLECMTFYKSFSMEVNEVVPDLETVLEASKEVTKSDRLKRMLQHVLVLGNYLNGGTFRGSARGFKLNALLNLKETKATMNNKDSGIPTLLHYMVRRLRDNDPESMCYMDDMPKVEGASRISIQTLFDSVKELRLHCDRVTREVETVKRINAHELNQIEDENIRKDLELRKDPFLSLMETFLPTADEKIKRIESTATTTEDTLKSAIELFGETPREYGANLEDFFGIFTSFSTSLARANSENLVIEQRKQRVIENARIVDTLKNNAVNKRASTGNGIPNSISRESLASTTSSEMSAGASAHITNILESMLTKTPNNKNISIDNLEPLYLNESSTSVPTSKFSTAQTSTNSLMTDSEFKQINSPRIQNNDDVMSDTSSEWSDRGDSSAEDFIDSDDDDLLDHQE